MGQVSQVDVIRFPRILPQRKIFHLLPDTIGDVAVIDRGGIVCEK